MRIVPCLAASLLLVACASRPPDLVRWSPAPSGVTVFRQVDVFPGEPAEVLRAQDVWVEEGTIRHLGPAGAREIPPGATVVDGEGLTLLPGLIDLHVHVFGGSAPPWKLALPQPLRNLQTFLWAGVTTVVDLGGELQESVELRGRIARGEVLGPRLLVAGPHVTAPGGHPVAMLQELVPWYVRLFLSDEQMAFQVRDAAQARSQVARLLSAGVDVVKVTSDTIPLEVPVIASEAARATVEAARGGGRKVFAHVGTNDDARRVLEAGVDVFAHGIYREPVEEDVLARLAGQGVAVIPTLAVFDTLDQVVRGGVETDAVQEAVRDPGVWKAIESRPAKYQVPAAFDGYLEAVRASRAHWLENVRRMREAGVNLLAGSDSPNVGSFGGAAFHKELRMLHQSGMSAAEVLRTATFLNARALGLEGEIGTVAVGRRADLLLVQGDPTDDLAHLHRIHSVYLGGRRLER